MCSREVETVLPRPVPLAVVPAVQTGWRRECGSNVVAQTTAEIGDDPDLDLLILLNHDGWADYQYRNGQKSIEITARAEEGRRVSVQSEGLARIASRRVLGPSGVFRIDGSAHPAPQSTFDLFIFP